MSWPAAAQAPAPRWPDYEVILWHRPAETALGGLRRLGISGTILFSQRERFDPAAVAAAAAPLKAAGLRWYVENIATDFYSAYHRWTPDRPVNWAFLEVQRRYRANPADPTVFHRVPSLSDPVWMARIRDRLDAHARLHRDLAAPGRPFFLNLGDEPGIADLSAAWDFDTAPAALDGFRVWLRSEYRSLAALNAQWGSAFTAWEQVVPETTDATLARSDGNHAAWSDFKAWMDIAFAGAIAAGREAVNAVDPALLAGIAGGQRPGWGGWDYALLAGSVDVLETYDLEVGRAVALGFAPDLVVLSTLSTAGPRDWHRLWREALRGMRGTILWDEEQSVIAADGEPGPRGRDSAAHFAALRAGVPAQLMAARAEPGAVAVLYSQPSFRLRWLLDRQIERARGGPPWSDRDAEAEHLDDNAWRMALQHAIRALAQQGVTPRWLTPGMLANGVPDAVRMVVLPHVLALGDAEAAALGAFVARGGVIAADAAEPAIFDGRGRRRATSVLATMPILRPAALQRDPADTDAGDRAAFAGLLRDAGALPAMRVEGPPAEIRHLVNGAVRLVALQRDADPTGLPFPAGGTVRLVPGPGWLVRPLGAGAPATAMEAVSLPLDPVLPTVMVATPSPLPRLTVRSRAGRLILDLDGPSPAAAHVLVIECLDPSGTVRPDRRWTRVWRGRALEWSLPDGVADGPGPWVLRVTDLLGGSAVQTTIEIPP